MDYFSWEKLISYLSCELTHSQHVAGDLRIENTILISDELNSIPHFTVTTLT